MTGNETIKILIVDDHWLFRQSLRMILQEKSGIDVVAEAENGKIAIEKVAEFFPDTVLMDIRMPVLGGIEATARIKQMRPQIVVIALTNHADSHYFEEMKKAGASDYLTKSASPKEIEQSIRKAFLKRKT